LSSPTLQPFVAYLQGRWQAGCTNVAQLKRELDAQGYHGSYSLLMQALSPWRDPRPPPNPTSRRRCGRPRVKRVNVRWLCLRPPEQLEPYECDALHDILNDDERLAAGYELLQRFRRLIARRSVRDLIRWLADSAESGLRARGAGARCRSVTQRWAPGEQKGAYRDHGRNTRGVGE
jgi:transposase